MAEALYYCGIPIVESGCALPSLAEIEAINQKAQISWQQSKDDLAKEREAVSNWLSSLDSEMAARALALMDFVYYD